MAYDFNKRDDFEYSHSFDYLGGVGLGKAEFEAERVRKSKLGKYDLVPVDPPADALVRDEIIKVAQLVHDSKNRDSLMAKIKQLKDSRMEFVWSSVHMHHKYFEWALHCLDREVVNWRNIRASGFVPKPSSVPTQPPKDVEVGDWVEIRELQARPELNTKIGKVIEKQGDRFQIDFPDIAQIVSISKSKCTKASSSCSRSKDRFPRGLRVEVMGLSSEQGKLLNGLEGYVMDFNSETNRYTVRLSNEMKSLKKENLFVCLPAGWTQEVDPASGEAFFRDVTTNKVTWEHPILGAAKKFKIPSEFVESPGNHESASSGDEDEAADFSRSEFLEQERKRLRLDKKRQTTNEESLRDTIRSIHTALGIPTEDENSVIFDGSPRELLEELEKTEDGSMVNRLCYVALLMILEDLLQLKFNKKQLVGYQEHLDEILESGSVGPGMLEWIKAGLKIAAPAILKIH